MRTSLIKSLMPEELKDNIFESEISDAKSNFSRGYIMLSRSIVDSEIFLKPPLYLKVWVYLITRAQHSEYRGLKRGQLFTSGPEIQAQTSSYIGARKVTPTRDQIHQILSWMRKCSEDVSRGTPRAPMITIAKATHGMLITICKYDSYNDPKNYESNGESNTESVPKATRKQSQPDNINNNVKNLNNEKNEKYSEWFEEFWHKYDKKVDKPSCLNLYVKIDLETHNKILAHLESYIQGTPEKQYRLNPKTYLKNKRWQDEIITPGAKQSKIIPRELRIEEL